MKYLLILLTSIIYSQSLKPTLGGQYIGGLDYDQDHEYFIGEIGLVYEPYNNTLLYDELKLTLDYHYDYLLTFSKTEANFYAIRLHGTKYFSDMFGFTYNIGYFDNVKSTYWKNNLTYGFGIQAKNEGLLAFMRYEQINNYPHVLVGFTIPMWEILKQ